MTPQEALAQALRAVYVQVEPDMWEDTAKDILDALPEGWALAQPAYFDREAYDHGCKVGAQQERERLRSGLLKVALADGWPHDWWKRADSQVFADPEDDR